MRMMGLMTALVTPFRDDRVDESALRALVKHQIRGGVEVLVPCGTTGESVTLSLEERRQVIALTLEAADGLVPVVAGVGSNDTRATIEAARQAEALGAAGVLVVTPYYNKPTQEGLFRHFCAVAEAISIEVCLYNVPGRTGVHLEPATVERLTAVSNITAIKEATGNMMVASEILLRCGDRIALLSGDDFTALPFLALGGRGVISVASNVVPDRMSDLVMAGMAGAFESARRIHLELYPLFQALFVESNPIPVKAALAMMGMMSGELRLPLCDGREEHRAQLRTVLAHLGLLGSQA